MICPVDLVQMSQTNLNHGHDPIGGGASGENYYITWELKECPLCEHLAVEYYTALPVVTVEEAQKVAEMLSQISIMRK